MLLLAVRVLVHAPAQWLASGVNAASRGHVQLRDAQGTVWRGSAQWVLTSGPGGQDALALPQRLHWQLSQPQWSGLQLTLECRLLHPRAGGVAVAAAVAGRLQVSAVIRRAVSGLHNGCRAWARLGTPWRLDGVLQLHSQELQCGAMAQSSPPYMATWSGSAELQLASSCPRACPPSSPWAATACVCKAGDSPALVLRTTEGHLLMQGRGAFGGNAVLSFEGEARGQYRP